MLRLIGDAGLQRQAMRGADGKDPVTALPMETRISSALGLQPLGRSRLDLLHQLRRRTGARVNWFTRTKDTPLCNAWLTLLHGIGVSAERHGDSSGVIKELIV